MPKICGELKQLANPYGGGFVHSTTHYTDGTSRTSSFKRRMVFPLIRIGDQALEGLWVASDQLGDEIANGVSVGQKVCLFTYGHHLRKKVIIGVRTEDGTWFRMPGKGLFAGLLFYTVFSPLIVLIPAVVVGMLVGMIGGRGGAALGLLLGVLYAVGISWYTAYRFYTAYREMAAS